MAINDYSTGELVLVSTTMTIVLGGLVGVILQYLKEQKKKDIENLEQRLKNREKRLEFKPRAYPIEELAAHRDLERISDVVEEDIFQMVDCKIDPKDFCDTLVGMKLKKHNPFVKKSKEAILYDLIVTKLRKRFSRYDEYNTLLDWIHKYPNRYNDWNSVREFTAMCMPIMEASQTRGVVGKKEMKEAVLN